MLYKRSRHIRGGRANRLTTEQINHARKLVDRCEACQHVADTLSVGCSTLYRALSF